MLNGFEVLNYLTTAINEVNIRQNILIKNVIGLSKFSKSTPLLNALNIKSIHHLYDEYKIIFMKQINKHNLSHSLYNFLNEYYKYNKKPLESYMHTVEKICRKIEIPNWRKR